MSYNIKVNRCKKCIMPESPGVIEFDDTGTCNLCNAFQSQEKDDNAFSNFSSEDKLAILQKKVDRYKNKGQYDCAIALSGGKDSIMTLYIAVKQLGLNPLAIFIDNGFALDEMYDNVKNATDVLGTDLIVYKTSAMIKLFPELLKTKKKFYYCRICHALLDMAILSIAKKYGIELVLGGYTKGQQYIKINELYWIYKESDDNIVEQLEKMPEFSYLLPLYRNQHSYFLKEFGKIQQLSPFKYVEWNEDEIMKIISKELKWKKPDRSWPDKSSNCSFNYVAQYLAEQQFGYAQHESELSCLVRENEITRERALEVIQTPIEHDDLVKALDKLGLTLDEII